MTATKIAEGLARNVKETGEALLYSELDYVAFCDMHDRPWAELVAYFGRGKCEQMQRRWNDEHSPTLDGKFMRSFYSDIAESIHQKRLRDEGIQS